MGDSVANNMSLKNGRTFWGEIMKLVRSFTHLYDVISQDKKVTVTEQLGDQMVVKENWRSVPDQFGPEWRPLLVVTLQM